jgi:catalase
LKAALKKEGAACEIISPEVGGVELSDGTWINGDQMIEGAPSVLYDAVALLPSKSAIAKLVEKPAARDFVSDAFVHCKFIGYSEPTEQLFAKAGIGNARDEGIISINATKDIATFIANLGKLRVWQREKH